MICVNNNDMDWQGVQYSYKDKSYGWIIPLRSAKFHYFEHKNRILVLFCSFPYCIKRKYGITYSLPPCIFWNISHKIIRKLNYSLVRITWCCSVRIICTSIHSNKHLLLGPVFQKRSWLSARVHSGLSV